MNGLIGRKLGMSRFFSKDGVALPVTIIKIVPNYVIQIKNKEKDGYCAIQIAAGYERIKNLSKPKLGHLKKIGPNFGTKLWEFRVDELDPIISVGDCISINILQSVKKVDITGISKGKGFAGTVKRWNFCMQDASHGNSLSHRAPGSIGQNQTPGKVFKGKKMAGQLGNCRVTVQNLDVVSINMESNFVLIKGAIPGSIGKYVIIKKSVKVLC